MPEKPLYPDSSHGGNYIPPEIKPIQTHWKRRHYRSRLEARWSVFFDVMKIKFIYEPEGYHLPDGEKYLPDFWLPDFRWFAEVKGRPGDCGKAYPFVAASGFAVLALDGVPDYRSYTGFQPGPTGPEHLEYSLDIVSYPRQTAEGMLFAEPDYSHLWNNVSKREDVFSLTYRAAVGAALSARFETNG